MSEIIQIKRNTYSISFSEYSTYLSCPHKWYLTYCLGFKGEMTEELVFGQMIHKSLEDIFLKPLLRKSYFFENTLKSNLKNELTRINDVAFLNRFNNSNISYVFIKQGILILKQLNFFIRFKDYEIVKVEYKLDGLPIASFEDMDFTFKGYIDLVLRHKVTGRILLVDWKTSRKKWDIKAKLKDNEDFFTQLGFYKRFYSIKENIPLNQIDVKFFNLPREEEKEMQHYDGVMNETYVSYLFEKLQKTCKNIYDQSPLELKKSKHLTKKNFCHRCIFNTEIMCSDYDEYQIITESNVTST